MQVVLVVLHQVQQEEIHYLEQALVAVLFVAQGEAMAAFILKVVVSVVAVEPLIPLLTMVVVTEDKVVIL